MAINMARAWRQDQPVRLFLPPVVHLIQFPFIPQHPGSHHRSYHGLFTHPSFVNLSYSLSIFEAVVPGGKAAPLHEKSYHEF